MQHDQKSYIQKFQKLQNVKFRKILKTFKTSSIAVMKIETNISSIKIRLSQKNQKLTLRIMKLNQRHSTRLKTFWNFFFERIHRITRSGPGFESELTSGSAPEPLKPLTDDDQFEDWNQAKKHFSQLLLRLKQAWW